jgi:hypothetical protein
MLALLVAGVCMFSPSACGGVTVERQESTSSKVRQVLEDGRGRFDLTHPPSRAEAGMVSGRSAVTYQRGDHSAFHVQVALPDGKEMALDTNLLTFDSYTQPHPESAPPVTMDVHHDARTLEEGRDRLQAAAQQFGMDAQPVEDWYTQAEGPRSGAEPEPKTGWLATRVGYLELAVQASSSPPVDRRPSDRTTVHYLLTWPPASG